MKNFKLKSLSAILIAILISSCGGLNKMQDTAETINFKTEPEILTAKGGDVDVTIKTQFPTKYFNKKAVVTAVPVIDYGEGAVKYDSMVFQGESVEQNYKVISFADGGSHTFTGSVPYQDEMRKSDLNIRLYGAIGDNQVELGTFKIADGVLATSTLVMKDPKPIMVGDKFQRINSEDFVADIHYLIQRADVRTSEVRNEDIDNLKAYVKTAAEDERKELKGMTISSYASPDGPMDLNEKLAENRQESAKRYIERELRRDKVEQAQTEDFFATLTTPEDWEGFKELVQESNIEDKELILRVLSMYSDPEVREREIKNLSAAYEELAEDILPELRRSKLIAQIDLIGLSDDEIVALVADDPDSLALEEILYAATLTDDLDKKLSIYQKASENHPGCFRARNNIGYVYVLKGDVDNAEGAFADAGELQENDVLKNNLGVIALHQGNIEEAKEYFTSATGAGENVNYNLGIIAIMEGNYEAAVNYFGNTCEFNTALAQVLNDQLQDALSTLNCIENDDAMNYYLKAVIGAKNENEDMVFSNLRTAVGKDSDLKDLAETDLEFRKYFDNETFQSIVE